VPRNRTARVAVLGSSVQRSAASGPSSTRASAAKRRIVVGGLVLLSLVLITLSFRSSALDGAQGTAADALRPFEVAANRVSRPFQDAAGWAHGLVNAKSENAKLRRQIASYRQQVYIDESALQENVALKQQLNYHGPPTVADFDRLSAAVLTAPPSASDASITIAAGSSDRVAGSTHRVAAGDVVITPDGLVGTISRVFSHVSRVMLLTDEESAVTAADLNVPTAIGVVQRGNGAASVLAMDLVSKAKHVGIGDTIITNGSLGAGLLPSMFPRGIQIGTVASAGINDINPYQSIQVQPFVDFTSLRAVIVLVPKS
jgi:rod shape-determining protein MreC